MSVCIITLSSYAAQILYVMNAKQLVSTGAYSPHPYASIEEASQCARCAWIIINNVSFWTKMIDNAPVVRSAVFLAYSN
jgi:hypothetical protein